MNGCDHLSWEPYGPDGRLACRDCGETLSSVLSAWEPYGEPPAGYGDAKQPSWRWRVATMVRELEEVA